MIILIKRKCSDESENYFYEWFGIRCFRGVQLIDYRDLESSETKAIQKSVGNLNPPPDYGLVSLTENEIICFIDVKCPDTNPTDTYNLPDRLASKYMKYAQEIECDVYLVFYQQFRKRVNDNGIIAYSGKEISGWSKIPNDRNGFNNRKISILHTPFEEEIERIIQLK